MAAKVKNVFFCNECGYESSKWLGQCPSCKTWNSFVEEPVQRKNAGGASFAGKGVFGERRMTPQKLSEVAQTFQERLCTGIGELDRVLGGGIVPGSMTLVGGDPGIGKSTLLLQVCQKLTEQNRSILYVSGEESLRQIKIRAARIGKIGDALSLLCETNLDVIGEIIKKERPQIVVIDSIQTMYHEAISSAPGSVSQVRESTGSLLMLAKGLGIAFFIIGHVTKEGVVAGPRVLEHMVDTVLYFEGDRHAAYRILRAVKNRFGSTNEIGVFEMRASGLEEVENPSEFMLGGKPQGASGSIVACSMEGSRPILLEVQALVCKTGFGNPRRMSTGFDYNRLNLILAVLEKRGGMFFGNIDAYINVVGGLEMDEPAADLALIVALAGIIAMGYLVAEALKAAEALENEGISARVLDMWSLKPLDEEAVIAAAKETGAIVTAENHNDVYAL